jgi:DUF4097 and DUF4098 domain-containing protein YvlB
MRNRIALAAACFFVLSGCDVLDFEGNQRFTADFHHTYPLKSGGRISVENFNGAIEIAGWDQETVDISGTKFANSEEGLNAVRIDIAAAPESISIRTVRPSERRGSSGARYTIRVPRRTQLDRIVSTNGTIRAEDLEGAARLRTSNGGVRVLRLKGGVEATTSNGTMELDRVEGGVTVRTSNGRIRAEGVRGSFDATTTNGSISLDMDRPEPNRPVKLETTNGSIEATLTELNSNDVQASTSNGSITLRLPAKAGARVQARTSRSAINTEFEVRTEGSVEKHRLEGVIGGGGPLLDLQTSNGSIRLLKM